MDILQLNAMALESRIAQELDNNPALEAIADDEEQAEVTPQPAPRTDLVAEGERDLVVREGDARDFERLDNIQEQYHLFEEDDGYRPTRSQASIAEESDARLDAMANTAARPASLGEHLIDQWRLVDVDDTTRALGERIIDALDPAGRLGTPLEQIAAAVEPPATIEQVKDALARVQQLEPAGVAARDLKECLILQLEALPHDTSLERRIIDEHFADLQANRLPLIARRLAVELDAVKRAVHTIARLSLHPGLDVTDRTAPPVVPDVLIEYNEAEDRYDARLTRGNLRELRISEEFREALQKARDDKATRDFLKQKIEAAAAIVDAVRFRRERLLEVARAVVDAQRDFFDRGEQHLRVLRMSELAGRFGCDPSTISRTVDDKWIQTPRGIYPLRRFFTGGMEAGNGEALGWDSIKAKVQEIVSAEDKRHPLSDDEIVSRLRKEGVDIKRRTVAKYRAQLGIPTARQRRQF